MCKNFEVQLAGRTDRYGQFGSSTTPKAAFRWTPSKEFLVRGSWAKGFRAPNLVEAGDSAAYAFNTVIDSRRCAINTIYCPAGGVPGIFSAGVGLVPEKSTSKSFGFVWDISKEASISVDGFDISQRNIIGFEGAQTILSLESTDPIYAARVLRAPADPADVARGAPGAITGVLNQFVNLTELRTKGYDIDLRWQFLRNELGNFTFVSSNNFVFSYKTQNVKTDPLIEFAGTYSFPKHRGATSFLWDKGAWSAIATWNHIEGNDASTSAPSGSARIGDWDTYDVQASYSGFRNLKLILGGRNILDKAPPIDLSSGSIPYDITQHNPRGAFYYATLNYKFK